MTIDPRLADQPISELERLLTPVMHRALRHCGAKTVGDAHAALTSGRFRRTPGVGAQREAALADALAFMGDIQQSEDRMMSLARAALTDLDRHCELRDFEGVAQPGIAEPIDGGREWGGAASRQQRLAQRLVQHDTRLLAAVLFYAGWGFTSPDYDDAVREDGGNLARAAITAITTED